MRNPDEPMRERPSAPRRTGAGAGAVGEVARALHRHILVTILAALLLSAAAAAAVGTLYVEHSLVPEVEAVSATAGRRLADPIRDAIEAGIPFDRLVGLEAFLATVVDADTRIGFAAVTDRSGRLVAAAGGSARFASDAILAGAPASTWRSADLIATPVAIDGDVAVGYVFVGVSTRPPFGDLLVVAIQIVLVLVAGVVAVKEIALALGDRYVNAPARALLHMSREVAAGNLTVSYESAKDRPIGIVLGAAASRLAAVNRNLNRLLLAAFAARSGHFEPAALRLIGEVVERLVRGLGLPASTGVRPLTLPVERTTRAAAFGLLTGEMLLLVLWTDLAAGLEIDLAGIVAVLYLPFIAGLAVGNLAATRSLVRFAGPIAFTAGALLSSAALVGVGAIGDWPALAFVRLLGGVGCGLAIGTLVEPRSSLAGGVIAAAVAGIGFGVPLATLLGPVGTTLVGAGVAALAGVAGAQFLPLREAQVAAGPRFDAGRREIGARLAAFAAFGVATFLGIETLADLVSPRPEETALLACATALSLLAIRPLAGAVRRPRRRARPGDASLSRGGASATATGVLVAGAGCSAALGVPELSTIPALAAIACFGAMVCTAAWAIGLRRIDVSTACVGSFSGLAVAASAILYLPEVPLGFVAALVLAASAFGVARR